ncbi:hypothetical protein OROGR_030743 [Orobanche gracilis]
MPFKLFHNYKYYAPLSHPRSGIRGHIPNMFSVNEFDDWRIRMEAEDQPKENVHKSFMTKDIHEDEDSDDEVSTTSKSSVNTSHTFENIMNEFKNIQKAHETMKRKNIQLEISNLELTQEHDLLKENYQYMLNDCENSKVIIEKLMDENRQLANELSETKSHIDSKTNDYSLLETKLKSLEEKEGESDTILRSFEKSSKILEEILSTGQDARDKSGLGYKSFSNNYNNKSSTVFVRSEEPILADEDTPSPSNAQAAQRTAKAAIPPPKAYHIQRNTQPNRPVRRNHQYAPRAQPMRKQSNSKRAVSNNQRPAQQYYRQYSASTPRYRVQAPRYPSRKQIAAERYQHQQHWETYRKPRRQAVRPQNMAPPPRRPQYWMNKNRNYNPNFCVHCYNDYSDYVPATRRSRTNGPTVTYSKPITVRKVWVPKGSYSPGPNNQWVPQSI